VAETLAAEAAGFVRRRRAEVFGAEAGPVNAPASGAVRSKTTPTDPVTVVDTETERLLRDRLAQLRPGDPILGEEGGGPADAGATPANAVTWVLDPIDGTVNFVYGIPAYAVSVGAQINGVSVAGAVADVVGATQAALLAQMLPVVRDVRRIGSAALDLCMVAAGRLDAYYEHGLQVWDRAAGALIAAEAGARVVVPAPNGPVGSAGLVVAAAPGIADDLLAALDRFGGLRPIPD